MFDPLSVVVSCPPQPAFESHPAFADEPLPSRPTIFAFLPPAAETSSILPRASCGCAVAQPRIVAVVSSPALRLIAPSVSSLPPSLTSSALSDCDAVD